MIKISAQISKKVPIPAMDYSSQAYGASLEIEVSDADKPDVIQGRLRELYSLLSSTIDEQISNATNDRPVGHGPVQGHLPAPQQNRLPGPIASCSGRAVSRSNGNGHNGSGRKPTGATEAQSRAIFAICKSLNIDMAALLADYNVTEPSQLHVKTASQIIDDLKSRQNGGSATHGNQ